MNVPSAPTARPLGILRWNMVPPKPLKSAWTIDSLFESGGETGALMRGIDWADTPLGPPTSWSSTLLTYVHLVLTAKQPMYLAWTRELIALYNDAYRPILGEDKHPSALGSRTADIFGKDGYPGLKPVFDAVLDRGESAAFTDLLVPLVRHGYMEECYFDVGYSPVHDGSEIVGVFSSVNEVTERILTTRRTRTLAALSGKLLGVSEATNVTQAVLQAAQENPHDLPFMVLYLPDAHGHLTSVGSVGLDAPAERTYRVPPSEWTGGPSMRVVPVTPLRAGPWPEPVEQAALLPLTAPGEEPPFGMLAVGLNARKHLDDSYRDFLGLFGGQAASALHAARLSEALRTQHEELSSRNAELDARNRALTAFEEWTRDLTGHADPYDLIERAQALLRTLIPLNAAVYYERTADRWYVKRMLGEYGNDELRRAHEAGLPHDTTANLRVPYETGRTYYQHEYDAQVDHLAPHMTHVTATAMTPLKSAGGVRGILGLGVFGRTGWTDAERTVIETVGHSLELALDRADKIAELAREREALRLANEELEAFAYSVSHDLRTPVRHIAGFTAMLRKSLADRLDSRSERYLTVVHEGAERMNVLIDALLDLSRTSRSPLRVGPVDLGALVESVRAELQADVLNRRVTWRVGRLPVVSGDPDLLRQVLLNLLSNALKYTRGREEAVIEVEGEDHPGEWRVVVRDNGVGFDMKYAGKLFGVFQRLHRAEEFEGVGVGLANVRRVVQRHGGRVFAEGQPGRGATFQFTLPKPT